VLEIEELRENRGSFESADFKVKKSAAACNSTIRFWFKFRPRPDDGRYEEVRGPAPAARPTHLSAEFAANMSISDSRNTI
jgi:hypothetical protein